MIFDFPPNKPKDFETKPYRAVWWVNYPGNEKNQKLVKKCTDAAKKHGQAMCMNLQYKDNYEWLKEKKYVDPLRVWVTCNGELLWFRSDPSSSEINEQMRESAEKSKELAKKGKNYQ